MLNNKKIKERNSSSEHENVNNNGDCKSINRNNYNVATNNETRITGNLIQTLTIADKTNKQTSYASGALHTQDIASELIIILSFSKVA